MEDQGALQGNQAINPVVMANNTDQAIRQYAIPMFNDLHSSIVRPEIAAPQFELKPVVFQMFKLSGSLVDSLWKIRIFTCIYSWR